MLHKNIALECEQRKIEYASFYSFGYNEATKIEQRVKFNYFEGGVEEPQWLDVPAVYNVKEYNVIQLEQTKGE